MLTVLKSKHSSVLSFLEKHYNIFNILTSSKEDGYYTVSLWNKEQENDMLDPFGAITFEENNSNDDNSEVVMIDNEKNNNISNHDNLKTQLSSKTVKELKTILKEKNLSATGNKDKLVSLILNHSNTFVN
jgi:hypothetical protein